jgi:hypothetical protein
MPGRLEGKSRDNQVGQRFYSRAFGKESHFFGKKIPSVTRGCEKKLTLRDIVVYI